jgi:hypothetical protein
MTDGPIANHWPDVPARAFSILRQIAQERQRQAEEDARLGFYGIDYELSVVAAVLCDGGAPRDHLVKCAALILRRIEQIDGPLEPPAPVADDHKLIRGR